MKYAEDCVNNIAFQTLASEVDDIVRELEVVRK